MLSQSFILSFFLVFFTALNPFIFFSYFYQVVVNRTVHCWSESFAKEYIFEELVLVDGVSGEGLIFLADIN